MLLRIRQSKHLARILGVSVDELLHIIDCKDELLEVLTLVCPNTSIALRKVVHAKGAFSVLQKRLLKKIFFHRLQPLAISFGSTKGRDVKQHAKIHCNSKYLYKSDISSFFDSIDHSRVYRLFIELDCSPDVAKFLTELCTANGSLSQGLHTSPILADRILRKIDQRILGFCNKCNCRYTRYVDDLTISADFDLSKSGIPHLVSKILRSHGFDRNIKKEKCVAVGAPESIVTGVFVKGGAIDIPQEYLKNFESVILASKGISIGIPPQLEFFTEQQAIAKAEYIGWINPKRKARVKQLVNSVCWSSFHEHALRLGLVFEKKAKAVRSLV